MKNDGTLADYGLNAVCTHLGCVVPWNKAENKFKCPCHGSQYNDEGKVIRGPAPLVRVPPDPPSGCCCKQPCSQTLPAFHQSLALAHMNVDDTDTVIFSTWTETDFRTGLAPWWK